MFFTILVENNVKIIMKKIINEILSLCYLSFINKIIFICFPILNNFLDFI